MKILVVSQYWYPENGVPQRRWTWLTQKLADAGHEVMVIAPPSNYQREVDFREWKARRMYASHFEKRPGPSGERILRSGFIPASGSLTRRIISQAMVALGASWLVLFPPKGLKEFEPDLVIGTVPAIPSGFVAYFASLKWKIPFVIDLRDAWPDLLDQADKWNKALGKQTWREKLLLRGPLQVMKFFVRNGMNDIFRKSRAITVTSENLRKELIKEIHGGDHNAPVITIRNVFPIETEFHKKLEPGTAKQKLNVLYAGTIGRAQHLENALTAATIAAEQGVTVNLRFVGAGAARNALARQAERMIVSASFESREDADNLHRFYEWADTALVHLTDWEPLQRAVPSKTYELMEIGLHISGVVEGETAELINSLGAGDVVSPEDPGQLAALWVQLAQDPEKLVTNPAAKEWVRDQRAHVADDQLAQLLKVCGE